MTRDERNQVFTVLFIIAFFLVGMVVISLRPSNYYGDGSQPLPRIGGD